jgi:hypothetical protein
MTLNCSSLPAVLQTAETPADSKALIKHYSTRLVVTQCYSVVKNRPALRRSHLGGFRLTSAQSSAPSDPAPVTVTEFYGVAADAQLKAVVLDSKPGGADRDRTGDPLVANQVLSQLSYSPFLVASD